MFSLLARWFDWPDRLSRLARGSDHAKFLRALAGAELLFLSLPEGHEAGIDADGLTEDTLLSEIETAAKQLSEAESFHPFTLEIDGVAVLPVFCSARFAEKFCGLYSRALNRTIGFYQLGVSVRALDRYPSAGLTVALNFGTKQERRLSAEEIAAAAGQ